MLMVQGCTQRVLVPPRIDLKPHEVIGILDFDCDGGEEFGPFLMDRFVAAVRRDQGMVRILRLGSPAQALAAVNRSQLDPAAWQAIGSRFGVQTIFTGRLTVSDVKPNLSIGQALTSFNVSADVDAALAVEMIEAATGASLWSASSRDRQRIGGVRVFGDKSFTFDADDPQNAYGSLVDSLIDNVTPDFRSHWVRVRKSK
jgi:hypothetical protein